MQHVVRRMHSIVVPVYRNADSIPALLEALAALSNELKHELEVVFVVDGSPDESFQLLESGLQHVGFDAQLILLSRNFGAFAAIRCGLRHATGEYIGVMAADLQEPPELLLEFFRALSDRPLDVVFGRRRHRSDHLLSRLASNTFWTAYRWLVQPDVPEGGVDVFAVTANFRDRLVALDESNSSMLGLLFWLGGRREFIGYSRRRRMHGKSAWTLKKKFTYVLDSVFAFSDLPVRLLMAAGLLGLTVAAILGAVVFVARISGQFEVPGYAGAMLAILFFGALNTFGIGIVGNYAWRAYENTKRRPSDVVSFKLDFRGQGP